MPVYVGTRRALLAGGEREIYALCPAITPALGGELFVDPGLEGTYTTGLCVAMFNKSGTPTVNESADVHGGAKAQEFTAAAQWNYISTKQALVANAWGQMSAWVKRTAGANGTAFIAGSVTGVARILDVAITGAAYAQIVQTGLGHVTNGLGTIVLESGLAFDTVVMDDFSLKAITFSSMRSLLGTRSTIAGNYACYPTVTNGTQCGILLRYLDDNNYVQAIVTTTSNNRTALIRKCVAGVFTTVITGTITYGAGNQLRVNIAADGVTYTLYYNAIQVGASTAINDAGLGYQVHGFNAYAGNTVGQVVTSKN